MGYSLHAGEVVHCAGDSLTQGGIVGPGGSSVRWQLNLQADLNAALLAANHGPIASLTYLGASGTQMAYFAANYAAVVSAFNPSLCFLMWGVNDVGSTAPATVAAQLATGVNGVWSTKPNCRFVIMSVINLGSLWPDGANTNDPDIDAINAAIQTQVAALKLAGPGQIDYVDVRDGYWFPAIQAANPDNSPTNYSLNVDGLHFNGTGADGVSNFVTSRATIIPGYNTTPPLFGTGNVLAPIGMSPATALAAGSESAHDNAKIAALLSPKNGAALTDADQTLTPGTDRVSQYVSSVALSADRVKTLSTVNAFTGLSVRIVRTNNAAHTLTINNGGPLADTEFVFPASPTRQQAATFMFNGTDWLLVAFEDVTKS